MFSISDKVLYTRLQYHPVDHEIESRIDSYKVISMKWDSFVRDWEYVVECGGVTLKLYGEWLRRRTSERLE